MKIKPLTTTTEVIYHLYIKSSKKGSRYRHIAFGRSCEELESYIKDELYSEDTQHPPIITKETKTIIRKIETV